MSTRARTGEPEAATDRANGARRASESDGTVAVPTGWTGWSSASATTVVPSQMRGDRGGRTRDGLVAGRVVDGVYGRFDTQDRDEEYEDRGDQSARAAPDERCGRQERDHGERPREVRSSRRRSGTESARRLRQPSELRRLERRALGAADVSVGGGRRPGSKAARARIARTRSMGGTLAKKLAGLNAGCPSGTLAGCTRSGSPLAGSISPARSSSSAPQR